MKHSVCSLVVALVFGMASPVLSTSAPTPKPFSRASWSPRRSETIRFSIEFEIPTGAVVKVDAAQITKIQDSASLPAGDYHLFLSEAPDLKTYWLYRMDKATGRVWFLSAGTTWIESAVPAELTTSKP